MHTHGSRLKFGSALTMFHAHCVFLWLPRHLHSLLPHLLLSDHLVLPSARQLHLPGCGGQIPCATPLRTLAPWPRTSLPQVVSPTSTTSRRLMSTTPRNPLASSGPQWLRLRWRHHRQGALRRVPKTSRSLWRRRPIVHDRTVRPVVCTFNSQVSSVQEIQRHNSESEQIRILLDRQWEQILADCQAAIRKHEFQADYDRRSIQKLNEMIESQKKKIIVLIKETNNMDEINNFFMNFCQNKIGIFVKLMRKASVKWKNWSDFNGRHSMNFREEDRDTILQLSQPRFRYYRKKLIVWMIREILKMLNQYEVDKPTLPVNQRFSHLFKILAECYAFLWECRAATMDRQVFGTHMVYRETFLQIQRRLL